MESLKRFDSSCLLDIPHEIHSNTPLDNRKFASHLIGAPQKKPLKNGNCRLQDLCAADRAKLNRLIIELAAAEQAAKQLRTSNRTFNSDTMNGPTSFAAYPGTTRYPCEGAASRLKHNINGSSGNVERTNSRRNESDIRDTCPAPDTREAQRQTWSDAGSTRLRQQHVRVGNRATNPGLSSPNDCHQEQMLSIVTRQQLQLHELHSQLKKVTRLLFKSKLVEQVQNNPQEKAVLTRVDAEVECTRSEPSASVACQTMDLTFGRRRDTRKIKRVDSLTKQVKMLVRRQTTVGNRSSGCQTPSSIGVAGRVDSCNESPKDLTVNCNTDTKNNVPVFTSLQDSQGHTPSLSSMDEINSVLSVIHSLSQSIDTSINSPTSSIPTFPRAKDQVSLNDAEDQILRDLFFLNL